MSLDISSAPSLNVKQLAAPAALPKSYPAPWKGAPVFACAKCSRKIRKHGGHLGIKQLKKFFRQRSKSNPDLPEIEIIPTGCMDLCPKGAITVTTPKALDHHPPRVYLIRDERECDALYKDF